MRRPLSAAVALLVLAMLAAGPATAAASGEPQVVDGCGVDGVAAAPTSGATTPWTDICSGVFSTLPGGSGLKVTTTHAGDIPDDQLGLYAVNWRVGDCAYRVSHERGLGEYKSNGVIVSDVGGDWLRIRCGSAVEEPCTVPVLTCVSWPEERFFALEDAVTVAGATVSFTLRFTGDVADVGRALPVGTQLTNLRLEAATKAVLAATSPGFCYGTMCGAIGGDTASGAGYTVGD